MNELTNQFNNQGNNAATVVAASREMEEVKGQIFMAQNMPRNVFQSEQRIMDACKRLTLAETAVYSYPRGGQKVVGPSIRLAEVLAQNWGNISFGVKELERRDGESTAVAYAWDMETNTRTQKEFTVPHVRSTKKGIQKLTDERDIYELVANMGARRLRSCLLGIIPGDIVDKAVAQCNETVRSGGGDIPLKDRIGKMLAMFKESYGVTQEQIENRFGYGTSTFTEFDMVQARNIFNSIKDGLAKVEDYFDKSTKKDAPSKLKEELAAKEDVKADVEEGAVNEPEKTNEG
ncbi:hypothetical protein BMT55_13905 [Listeria newyorkensis]|uniref:Uncharacterized protein n=1 Tax=Listeria newyorkensis TaxID=1497681 RepID=A0ABX4XK96_9LIST|nr:hypothetical protein [Listeria newyorkensis]KGL45724.1 hypothetical protein EP58_03260 [Listeria newyorkensis]KMT62535.1 hypothetical protein X559_1073 [Listeria newyorkensis]PNP88961.1 hypothetical protein BMT55_13905 [Listeria newyorkensis]SQC55343.1 Uncharacterised protein [Listeria newyorkensis]